MVVMHAPYSAGLELLALIIWMVGMKCSAMNFDEMDRLLGEAVVEAMKDAKITIQTAINIMKIDESMFRKSLKGERMRNLALNHLIKLGPVFMVHLTANLMWLTAKQRANDIVETLNVRRNS